MKNIISVIFLICCFISVKSQDKPDETVNSEIIRTHQVKVGSSIQYEWTGGYYYYYDDFYYYDRVTTINNYDGPNTQLFLAYEHIWTFPTRMGVSIEPKLGLSFREYLTNGFVGVNWKFYWADLGNWRMGIYLYTGYEYLQGNRSIYVSMEDGMYRKRMDLKVNQNVFSFDLGLVPIQFTPKNTPLSVELNFNLLGLHVFKIKSEEYDLENGETGRYKYSDLGGYGPRVELKLGWEIR